ncbi:MAG: murein biosynthesis integral membrane protein MurJ [bacterium]|nr:murein biosynthesis integral membrane protein MurJ [bacterium]
MVKKVFTFISREIGGLHEAAYILGFFALLSQILALVRDRLLAYQFGAGHELDIYYAAFRIPDFIFVSIASIVSMSVLIPFLMERLEKGKEEAREFINAIFSFFFLVIGITSLIVFFFTPYLVKTLFPAFEADFSQLILMTRIMLLSPIFLGFSNFLAGITQVYKRFFIYALSPIIYNLGIITGIVLFYPLWGMSGLAWGVALGAFLHCMIQLPFVARTKLFPRLTLRPNMKVAWKVLLVSLPRTVALSSSEISKFFQIILAAGLATGAISIFNFAWNLQSVPLSIIGVSYSLAAFPLLTKLFTTGEHKKFLSQMITSTKHIIFWSVPIIILFIVLRAQIVRVILGAGDFSWSDTRLTAAALALFVLSLVPQSLVLLFLRSYYARGDTKRPLIVNITSAILIVAFSVLFIRIFNTNEVFRYFIEDLFRIQDIPGSVVLMLPLGYSVGMVINMILHWILFEFSYRGYSAAIWRSALHIISASVLMGYVSYVLLDVFDNIFDINTAIGIFLQGFLAGIGGIIFGVSILVLLKNHELHDIVATLHRKIWKAKVVPTEPTM